MFRLLVSVLLRQANANSPGDPGTWLTSLQATKWGDVNKQNGQITGTSVNGKNVTLQAVPGCSIADLLMATEVALQCLDRGLDHAPSRTSVRLN